MTKKKSLIWEIKKNNIEKGYLFGTMHVSGKVAFPDFSPILKLIDTCECLATEISLDNKSQREMGKHMNLPAHSSLNELLSEKQFNKIDAELRKYFELELKYFANVMPLFLINLITQKSIIEDDSLLNQSMDLECWNYANNKGKIMDSVETFDDHINTLYKIPLTYQIKALKSTFANIPKFKKKSKKVLDVYKSQDIHLLYKSSKKSLGIIKEDLLYKRNYNMVDRIESISNKYKTFFAFGAGHLSGEKGVIHLLKQKRFQVIPMKF